MRMFKRYLPKLIAKHVSRIFNGRIYIDGRGGYHFEKGILLVPLKATNNIIMIRLTRLT